MLSASEVASRLGYTESANWIDTVPDSEDAHLLRRAREAGVVGTYVFRTSPEDYPLLPPRALIHVAEARTIEEAQTIHKRLWNLGDAPFLIVILPEQVRVYTNFRYEHHKDRPLRIIPARALDGIASALSEFNAAQIDSGRIWQTWGRKLNASHRVDQQLLTDLNSLGAELIGKRELKPQVAHSLIGKYIYIRYLRERGILSDTWLEENRVDVDQVLGRNANLPAFRTLVDAIEERFNGRVFPLPLEGPDAPGDDDISFVSQVLLGDSPSGQMSFDFRIYDFSYIPVELLSSIYEQFLHAQGEGKRSGAYYTPEPLGEYLLSEINSVKPLQRGTRILDPCCGSGIFLVLAYRRLIEHELRSRPERKLRATEVRAILTESIFGVERNPEACFVTEFSLLLTMLTYIDPPELHRIKLKFPGLHNTQIFQQDFFDPDGPIWKSRRRFDWVVGNPPWVELNPREGDEKFAIDWMREHAATRPVARFRTAEAFSWRVDDLLAENGYAGLVIHATSLSNEQSGAYRRAFFAAHHTARVTNFSNLAYVLFDKRAEAPAATIVYRPIEIDSGQEEREPTIHYGPFVVNQVPIRTQSSKHSWVITVYESEISVIEPSEVQSGRALTWKMALWGTYRDQKLLSKIQRLFPTTVQQVVAERGCNLALGVQLREEVDSRSGDVEYRAELRNTWVLDPDRMNASRARYAVPRHAIVPNNHTHIRKRGGTRGLALIRAPHVVISPTYAAFSEEDFVFTHPRVGISGPREESDFLRALSVYLNSNLAKYLAFFGSSSWGIDRSTFGLGDVGDIPIPRFSEDQVVALAKLHRDLAQERLLFEHDSMFGKELSTAMLTEILGLPSSIAYLVDEFVEVKLAVNKGKARGSATDAPGEMELRAYGEVLKEQLDSYAGVSHAITIRRGTEFIVCEIQPRAPFLGDGATAGLAITTQNEADYRALWTSIRYTHSQWVYVQRSLRLFSGDTMILVKAARRLDWTRMQALLDSDDVIAEVLSTLATVAEPAAGRT